MLCRIYAPIYLGADVVLPGRTVPLSAWVARQAIEEGRAREVKAYELAPRPEPGVYRMVRATAEPQTADDPPTSDPSPDSTKLDP